MKLPSCLRAHAHRPSIITCAVLAALGLCAGVVSAAPFLSVDLGNSQSVVQAGFQSFNQHNQAGVTYSTSEGGIFVNVAGEQPAGEDGYFDRGSIPDNPPFT